MSIYYLILPCPFSVLFNLLLFKFLLSTNQPPSVDYSEKSWERGWAPKSQNDDSTTLGSVDKVKQGLSFHKKK